MFSGFLRLLVLFWARNRIPDDLLGQDGPPGAPNGPLGAILGEKRNLNLYKLQWRVGAVGTLRPGGPKNCPQGSVGGAGGSIRTQNIVRNPIPGSKKPQKPYKARRKMKN